MRAKHVSNPLDSRPDDGYYANPRTEVIELLQRHSTHAKRIVEIGCGGGQTIAELKRLLGADFCLGVEMHEAMASVARGRIDQVIVADLATQSTESLGVREQNFDLLLALDVLEHLYDPWSVLADWATVLRPGGRVAISLPNLQHLAVLLDLSRGKFDYQSSGLLDATHIRFFTAQSAAKLVAGAGLRLIECMPIFYPPMDLTQLKENGNTIAADHITLTNLTAQEIVGLTAFQFVLLAERPAVSAPEISAT